ncbi:hypothetical protein CJO66_23630 [Burkholderia ubonensis]|uniref:Uncharacterized protein n=1 Tax=Burkholderia ubonensis TaxID=101571 RepID=A0AB74D3X8_9BURK|nr:hypothetical protein CJO71_19740 [Burkholderia ubonensis]PAJ84921.1 hypothetical protein CJO70_25255 [Burkholderia ubonensis]PAJ91834.1 hypothetical protein CJO69_24880 [Burkholderia ubonensis]PAJ98843.1 hypothetical protein CJO68_22515 [Burkholderia ubonensis]PAK04666.1 hypothetical protein CJO67_27875 [Burkholderia ubonensis]
MNGASRQATGLERTEWYGKGLFGSASRNEMVCCRNYKNRNRLLILMKNNRLRNLRAFERSRPMLSISPDR